MIKTMLRPFFKKFFGLFMSMAFVSMLSVALLCCFGSSIVNTKNEYKEYIEQYQDMDELIATNFVRRDKLLSVGELNEVNKVDARLTVDAYVKKPDRTIVGRIFTYDDDPNSPTKNTIFKRHINESVPYVTEAKNAEGQNVAIAANIGVCSKYARNNNFKLGDVIQIGFFNMYANFYIAEIVETPEGIYPRANNYIWSDNHDFGYIYASEAQLSNGLRVLAQYITDKITEDENYKKYYELACQVLNITIPDIGEILADQHFASNWGNQIMVQNKKGVNLDDAVDVITQKLNTEGVNVKTTTVKTYMPHIAYMNHALEQVQVASIFLPVFFYSVTMIVVGLFLNQIIKAMTPQIGVMMSIGIDKKEIVELFMIFTILMALTASILGAPAGFALNILLSSIMKRTYSIPTIVADLHPLVVIGAVIGLLLFTLVTTMISCQRIFKITPKDATISNEAKRKRLPKPVEKLIDKAPMTIKLGTNSIMQNPRRFFVSAFSIFASIILILLSTLFYVSKEEMIDQSVVRRMNYDVQVYLTTEEQQDKILQFETEGKEQGIITDFLDCYYTYLKVDNAEGNVYLECISFDPTKEVADKLIKIPTSSGKGQLKVQAEGIVLPSSAAKSLKVKKGDQITINGKLITVSDISNQYFHPITYLSSNEITRLGVDKVSSYIMNITSEKGLQDYITSNRNQCLTVFTSSLSKDLHAIFDATNVMIYIMVAFSIGMAFIILSIMSQNALMEQQRQLTIFRAVGFTILDISNLWTLQSIGQLVIAGILGVPTGALAIYILLSMCSNAGQTYPFIFSWPTVFIALGFILLVLIACHLISMRSIKKWNIANNTRSRE